MKKDEFINLVLEELNQIKKNATTEEINRLNILTFNEFNVCRCIYGQLTGSSLSERAKEIFPKVFRWGFDGIYFKYANFEKHESVSRNFYTYLEKYLFFVFKQKHLEIIQYLKGEISEIDLNVI